ncbi:MAG TPA: nitrile hydratase subunit beta [Dehalococcoidia bacterium]|jgi:hypothetical protein|nr:nitrile hydratase subunit beta [Dehalococcoidia bacterium]
MATASTPARFGKGQRVKVRVGTPPTHFRTPEYIQSKTGVVVALFGSYRNPESLGHGGDGLPMQPLYLVEFDQNHLWENYQGPDRDTLQIEVFENWLEPEIA